MLNTYRVLFSCCTALGCAAAFCAGAAAQELPSVEINLDVLSKFSRGGAEAAFGAPPPAAPAVKPRSYDYSGGVYTGAPQKAAPARAPFGAGSGIDAAVNAYAPSVTVTRDEKRVIAPARPSAAERVAPADNNNVVVFAPSDKAKAAPGASFFPGAAGFAAGMTAARPLPQRESKPASVPGKEKKGLLAGALPPAGKIIDVMRTAAEEAKKEEEAQAAVAAAAAETEGNPLVANLKKAGDLVEKGIDKTIGVFSGNTDKTGNTAETDVPAFAAQETVPTPQIVRLEGESETDFLNRKYNARYNSAGDIGAPAEKQAGLQAQSDAPGNPGAPEKGNIYTLDNLRVQGGESWSRDIHSLRSAPPVINTRGGGESYAFMDAPAASEEQSGYTVNLPWKAEGAVRKAPPASGIDTGGGGGLSTVYSGPAPLSAPKPSAGNSLAAAAEAAREAAALAKRQQAESEKKAATPAMTAEKKADPAPVTGTPAPKKADAKPAAPAAKAPQAVQKAQADKPRSPEPETVQNTAPKPVPVPGRKPQAPSVAVKTPEQPAVRPASSDIAPPPGREAAQEERKRFSLFDRKPQEPEKPEPVKEKKIAAAPAPSVPAIDDTPEKKDAEDRIAGIRDRLRQIREAKNAGGGAEPENPPEEIAAPVIKEAPQPQENAKADAAEMLRRAIARRAAKTENAPLPPSDSDIPAPALTADAEKDMFTDDSELDAGDFIAELEEPDIDITVSGGGDNSGGLSALDEFAALADPAAVSGAAEGQGDDLSSDMSFAKGEDALNASHKSALDSFIAKAKQTSEGNIHVVGYASAADKTPEYISLRRVVAVRNYIMNNGFPNDRIRIKAKGDKTETPSQQDKVLLFMSGEG